MNVKLLATDQSGSVSILSAAFLTVSISAAALALDTGALQLERRQQQGIVDLAAMSAAANPNRSLEAARAALKSNGIGAPQSLAVVQGRYIADASVTPDKRFQPGVKPYNAASVTMTTQGHSYFSKFFAKSCCTIKVSAIGSHAATATFSVATRLVAVHGGVANSVLGSLLGSNVSLSVLDYNALTTAEVTNTQFLKALSKEVNVPAGTYNDVLTAPANVGDVIAALATAAGTNGNTRAEAALKALSQQHAGDAKALTLGSLLDLGPLANVTIGDPAPGLEGKFKISDLLTSASLLANGNSSSSIDLNGLVPGLLSLKLDMAIGPGSAQTPWVRVGEPDSIVRAVHTRIRLVAEVAGTGALKDTRIKLPLYADLAYGEGRLSDITCGGSRGDEATVAARSGVAETWIGDVTDAGFKNLAAKPTVNKANIVETLLIKVRGRSHVDVGNTSEKLLTFTRADVDAGTIKHTDTSTIGQSAVTTLLTNLSLEVTAVGIGLPSTSAIQTLVSNSLSSIAPSLDTVFYQILTTLGAHAGDASVRMHGIGCGNGVLTG